MVVPFAGDATEALAALALLRSLSVADGDQLILSDNSGTAPPPDAVADVTIVRAEGEASPAHARNVGARAAQNDWILFLDADVRAPRTLLDDFFSEPIPASAGAVTGDIAGTSDATTLAARYGTARNFLGQRSHLQNPFRPRASSANLLVRRAAFERVGGYREGIRRAEDTDFTWRLQDAGFTLEFQPGAIVQHEYRQSLRELGDQWRGYAQGAAWLAREYPGFRPDPGLNRGIRILLARFGIGPGVAFRADGRSGSGGGPRSRLERFQFLLIQCMLGIEEQIGLRMSNEIEPRRR